MRAKLRDPEFLNLLARPLFDPTSASTRRRALSLALVALVVASAVYELGRGTTESESFQLSSSSVYSFDGEPGFFDVSKNYGFAVGRAVKEIWQTSVPDAQSSWNFMAPETKGNIPTRAGVEPRSIDQMTFHNVGTVEQDGISFANKMPEYPLVFTVWGPAAQHATLVQNFQQTSLCREKLLAHVGGIDRHGKDPLSMYARIKTRMSGSTAGQVIEDGTPDGRRLPSGLSSSTLLVQQVGNHSDVKHTPWFGTGLYHDFSECDVCTRNGENCRGRNCFASARVKLCGRRLEGTVNGWSRSQPDSDVAVEMPLEFSNTTLEISIESIGPGEFGCERSAWYMMDGSQCNQLQAKRSNPSHIDLPPYVESTLMSRMRLRLKEGYFPYFDGYGLEFTGMITTRVNDPMSKIGHGKRDRSNGQSLTVTLNGIDFFRTKMRYSVFGVIGGMASVFAFVIGFLADLCDPTPNYGGEEKEDGKGKGRSTKSEGEGDGENKIEGEEEKGGVGGPEKELDGKWVELVQKGTGKMYFHNPMSGETSWSKPNE